MIHIRTFLNNPVKILVFFVIFVLISSSGLTNFKLDASSDALVLEGDESFREYRNVEKEFGDSSFLIVTYEPENELFSTESINTLQQLKNDLLNVDGVESILSLLDAPIFFQPKVDLADVSDNLKYIYETKVDLKLAKQEFLENPIYKDLIISNDGKTTALQIILKGNTEYSHLIDRRYEINDIFASRSLLKPSDKKILDEELYNLNQKISSFNNNEAKLSSKRVQDIRLVLDQYKSNAKIYLGGPSMIASDMMDFIKSDLSFFGYGVALIFMVVLFLFFGHIYYVLLPIVNAAITVILTASFLGFMDWKISVVSSNFIALLLILTISLTVHILVRINELSAKIDNYIDCLNESFKQMFYPCLFAALTTAVAFLSLIFSEIKPVIEFGKMMSFGIFIAFISSFTILPCLLAISSKKRTKDYFSLSDITTFLFNISKTHKNIIIIFFVSASIILFTGLQNLKVENKFIDYFNSNTEIYQGMLEIDTKLGGTATLDIIISEPTIFKENPLDNDSDWDDELFEEDLFFDENSDSSGYWWNTFSLKKLENIHDYLEDIPEIGKVLSVASGLKLARKINDGDELNDIELALLRSLLPDDIKESLLDSYINNDDSVVRLSTRVNESYDGLERDNLIKRIDADLIDKFGLSKNDFEITGLAVLYNNMLQSLFDSQINSLLIVFSCIGLMFLFIFRSFVLMIIGLLPNIFVALSVIGLLGLLSIPLDIMTITVAAISVGMAVDNSIHYIYRYKKEMKETNNQLSSIKKANLTSGKAIFYTATTISSGFLILISSNFFPTILFGIFTAIAMLVAFLISLTLLPILLIYSGVFKNNGTT